MPQSASLLTEGRKGMFLGLSVRKLGPAVKRC
jgi:hypothetical protein